MNERMQRRTADGAGNPLPPDAPSTAPPSGRASDPADAIGRILDKPPLLANEVLRGDTRLTRRWGHGALHSSLPALSGHVIMTYYGAAQEIEWREGGLRHASRTLPGAITLIPDGHGGRWDINGPIEVSHVYLTDQRLQSCADILAHGRQIELIGRVGFEDPTTSRLMEMLGREAALNDSASRLFVEQAVDLLCIQLVRGHSTIGTLVELAPRRGLADWQVRRVTNYMQDHLDQEISLEEVAALVGLSRFHFCTAFRLATRQSPHQWLTALRIGRARQLLAEPSLPITEIALAVGYQTPSAFAASFRKMAGVTPSEFRRAL
jgi:AraC family transcriptional regulator